MEILIPLAFFGLLAAVILVPVLARERTKRSAHDLVSQAMARGQQLDPTLISQLSASMVEESNKARASLGKGVILLALAGGFAGAGFVAGGFDADAHRGMLIPAVVLAAVGAAYLLLAIIDFAMKPRNA
jgi:hypothetical protein